MLATEYGESQLLDPSKERVGQRLPNPITEDGTRLYSLLPGPGLVCAREDIQVRRLAESAGLPFVRTSVPLLLNFFNSKDFVALIRPDRIVGCLSVDHPSTLDELKILAALGKRLIRPGVHE